MGQIKYLTEEIRRTYERTDIERDKMMQQLIKRGVLAVAAGVLTSAVVLMGMAPAQAANVSVDYLFRVSPQTGSSFRPITGYQDQFSINGYVVDTSSPGYTPLLAGNLPFSSIHGMSATQQVGFGYISDLYGFANADAINAMVLPFVTGAHAYVWNGSTASGVDLHPAGYVSSFALGTDGNHQVGEAAYSSAPYQNMHAMLWNGTAESAVNLNPAGFNYSMAAAVNGDVQGGFVGQIQGTGYIEHAALWHGSAETFVDLNSAGLSLSYVTSVTDDQQFGYGRGEITANQMHALMWNGTAESVVDLHPGNTNYSRSYVTGANADGMQIGIASFVDSSSPERQRAAAWQGSAESFIDLSASLDNSMPWFSLALGIDGNDIYGVAWDDRSAHQGLWAVKWTISTFSGDTNLDGVVDITDYNNVINNFGGSGLGDTNNDGVVDVSDFNSVINNFGSSEAMAVSLIPEPTSLGLLGIGAMGLLTRRRMA